MKNSSDLTETLISTETAYQGSFLKIKKDTVSLPDGTIAQRESILHPGASLVVPYLSSGHFIMVEQFRSPLKRVFIEFPAGKIDPNETPVETARRELKEEAGCLCKNLTFLTEIHPVIGYSNEVIYLYIAEDIQEGEQQLDSGEFVNLFKITPAELQQQIWANKITDVKTQIAAFWAFRHLGI